MTSIGLSRTGTRARRTRPLGCKGGIQVKYLHDLENEHLLEFCTPLLRFLPPSPGWCLSSKACRGLGRAGVGNCGFGLLCANVPFLRYPYVLVRNYFFLTV